MIRVFGGQNLKNWAERFGMKEGEVIESRMVSKSIEKAQKRVEEHHFDMRKNILKYDDVMNKQRESVYRLRRDILAGKGVQEWVKNAWEQIVGSLIDTYCPEEKHPDQWDRDALEHELADVFDLTLAAADVSWDTVNRPRLEEALKAAVETRYE